MMPQTVWEQQGSQGSQWIMAKINIKSVPELDGLESQFTIEMTHGGWETDAIAAVDDIVLYGDNCTSVGM